jgi:hypothetical protein
MAEKEISTSSLEEGVGISVMIERPPEKVFAVLTDVASHTDWARGPEEIKDVSDNPARLGTTWQQVHKLLGKKLLYMMRVNAHEENRKFGFASDKPFPMHIIFSLEPVSGGTNLNMVAGGEPASIFGKMAMPILTRSVENQMESDLYTLKAILEAED